MENKKPMTELDALAQLSELMYTIENNNWNGVYDKVESTRTLTPLTLRQQKEIENLKKENHVLKELSKETENKYSQMRVKLGAFKHLLKEIPDA